MGSAIRNTVCGIAAASGALLGAYLRSNLGPQLSFYVMSATYLLHTFTAAFIIKEPSGQSISGSSIDLLEETYYWLNL